MDAVIEKSPRRSWLVIFLRAFLSVALPFFLVLTSTRLVMTELFLQLEYHRPGFPEDRYGFTQEDRLKYAPYAVQYLLNDSGISYLGDLELDGLPMFEPDELKHMEDVKVVTRAAFQIHTVLTVAVLLAVILLARRRATREALRDGLFGGGLFTLSLIVALVVLVLANWDYFFTGFHQIFFEGDSWKFSTSDTLIRLFPEQFWFDAAMTSGFLTVFGAAALMLFAWLWHRRVINIPAPQ